MIFGIKEKSINLTDSVFLVIATNIPQRLWFCAPGLTYSAGPY